MSLFRARDWWTTNAGSDETFGSTSMCIANIDNNRDGTDKIVIGSYEGILRIYATANTAEDPTLKPFQANDLLLETDLKLPILQVAAGLLLSASKSIHLAVLHPRKLSVYSAAATLGVTEYGAAYNILLIYEHNLPRSAYNLTIGPFGQIKGRDFICVQSLDGTLTFYEQESFAFSRHLTNFMLPGPIVYLPTTDSFIVSGGSWTIESFRYQVLAISKNDETKTADGSSEPLSVQNKPSSSGRRVTPDWSIVIGEPVLDIAAHTLDKRSSLTIVLGERNLFLLRESGAISWMKKLNFTPTAMHSYPNDAADGLIVLVTSERRNILIYNNNTLRWSCQLPFTPITLARASFLHIHGVLVTLSSDGLLACSYLGTNPSSSIGPVRSSDIEAINYAETERELSELHRVISAFNNDPNSGLISPKSSSNIKSANESDIIFHIGDLNVSVSREARFSSGPLLDDLLPVCTFTLKLESPIAINHVQVSINGSSPFLFEPSLLIYPGLSAGAETPTSTVRTTLSNLLLPTNLECSIIVTYTNVSGGPRVACQTFHLPLSLICRPSQSLRETPFSLNLTFATTELINAKVILFDLVSGSTISNNLIDSSTVSIGFFVDPSLIVILNSTAATGNGSGGKVKLRSDSFHALALVGNELIRRCKSMKLSIEPSLPISSADKSALPLTNYFELIDKRFFVRTKLQQLQSDLAAKTNYFRAVQKRLLVKFKDRNPTPLANLDILLDDVYSKILSLTNQLVEAQSDFEKQSNQLAAATQLLHNLIEITGKLSQESCKMMKNLWNSYVKADIEEGWEERTEIAMNSAFSESLRDRGGSGARFASGLFEMADNCDNLKILISAFVEKIFSGEVSANPLDSQSMVNSDRSNRMFQFSSADDVIQEEDDSGHDNQVQT